jgi:hypothetical protein
MADKRPIRYVLYSHYAYKEKDDFEAYQKGTPVAALDGVRHFLLHTRGLKELLAAPGHEGLLVLFYAPGYEKFLERLAQGGSLEALARPAGGDVESQPLEFAGNVARYIEQELEAQQLADRVRFLTSRDLTVILGRVNAIVAKQFQKFFIGPARGLRYDTSKVVEAILRLRVLGNGVPVLRFDHDVIFRETNQAFGELGLFKAVACAVRAYQLRLAEPSVSTFLFSASYDFRALLERTQEMDRFEAWGRAFATRVYPALVADPDRIRAVCALPKNEQDFEWDRYVATHLDETLTRRFYGLKEAPGALEVDGSTGLASVGAHPLYAVISGALLCLSEGAILDLPPFSNLGMNVMWIDDHLKYSLHRAMNHFTSGETLDLDAGLSDARMDNVTVTKARPAVSNLPAYVFDVYLPTLLWGTIMDAWITDRPILKRRVGTLTVAELEVWRKAKDEQKNAPLPSAMLQALRIGSFEPGSEQKLREDLATRAAQRIEEVRQLWANLKSEHHTTFASYWAEGRVREVFGDACFRGCNDPLWQGIAPGRPLTDPITALDDLSAAMAVKIKDLISDTVAYIDWTLEWPRFVQIVRSIPQGDFKGDLAWTP